MEYNRFRSLVNYDIRLIVRNSAFKIYTIFVTFSMLIYIILLHTRLINPGMETWDKSALPSFIPLFAIITYDIGLCILIIYLNNYFPVKRVDTYDTMYIKPISNGLYILGKAMSMIYVCIVTNIVFCLACIGIHILLTDSPFYLEYYIYVLITVSFPIFIFAIGLSLFLQILIKIRFISSFLALLILIGFFYFCDVFFGCLDLFCLRIPTVVSEIIGSPFRNIFLFQRLFFLFLGCGFILFSIALWGRLDYITKIRIRFASVGGLVCIIACLFVLKNYTLYYRNILLHNECKKIYNQYSKYKFVAIVKHEIDFNFSNDIIKAKSIITVCNKNLDELSSLILYLNPGLKIDTIRTDRELLNYKREYQAIDVETRIQPGDTMSIYITYSGKIDEYVCYTDVDFEDYVDQNINFTYQYGKKYVFLSKKFILLTPECLWYPVSLPPNNPDSPYDIKRDFTYFNLKVKDIPNKTIISQGIESKNDGYIEFVNSTPLPCISLTIGNYERFSTVVDSVNYELFYYKNNDFYVDYFKTVLDSIPSVIRKVRNEQEYMRNRRYIFPKFSLVEVPIQFYSYNRRWKSNTEFVMPEMVYFPEHGTQMGVDLLHLSQEYDLQRKLRNEGINDKNYRDCDLCRILINNILTRQTNVGWMGLQTAENNKFNNSPMFFEFINYIHYDACPLIDVAFNTVLQNYFYVGRKNAIQNYINSGIDDTQRALVYLNKHSLKEATADKEIGSGLFAEIIKLKTQELKKYLTTIVPEEEIGPFFNDIIRERPFTVIAYDTINNLFFQKYNVKLSKFVNQWYMNTTIARLHISNVGLAQINNEGIIKNQVSFVVENTSESYGIITVIIDNEINNNYYIEPNEKLEINISCAQKPTRLNVKTNIAQNNPQDYSFGLYYMNNSIFTEKEEIIVLDTDEILKPDNDIIIDDLNSNFSIIEKGPRHSLLRSKENVTELYDKINYNNPASNWTKITNHNCYGDIVRSAVYKKRGHGNNKIVWNVPIEKEGYYEVFIWNVKVPYQDHERIQTYTLLNSGNPETMDVDFTKEENGWVSIGNFYLIPPLLKIELADNVSGKYVIADAVKISPI